jgi:hypothetical protein
MSTLADVQSSMQGEAKVKNPTAAPSFDIGVSGGGEDVKQEFVIFKLVKRKRGRTYVDGISDGVPNPKRDNKRERIWLINGADSIWQSELTELLKDKEYVKRNRSSLIFEDGVCRIRVKDELRLEYARLNANNVGSKDVRHGGKFAYYEYDAAAEQKARLAQQMVKVNMVKAAVELPVPEMKKLASYLGIVFFDDLGQPKGDDGIRAELMLKADGDPDNFKKYLGSPVVDVAWLVKKAILDAKIDLTAQEGKALWAGGKGFIAKIPSGKKAYEYLTELAMTNSDVGTKFLKQLEEQVAK